MKSVTPADAELPIQASSVIFGSLSGTESFDSSQVNCTPEDEVHQNSQILFSVCWCKEKLGAAFFEVSTAQIYVVEDKPEQPPHFTYLRALFRELRPRHVIVGGRQDQAFYCVLQELCQLKRTAAEANQSDARTADSSSSETGSTSERSSVTLHYLSGSEFKYASCLQRVLRLKLPLPCPIASAEAFMTAEEGSPNKAGADADERSAPGVAVSHSLLQAVLDVHNCVAATRALGGLLRFLDKHGAELLPADDILDSTPVLGLQSYTLADSCYLDAESLAALQVLAQDEHPAPSKAGACKEGLSLLSLLSRTASPLALPILRRVLLRPLKCQRTLEERYDVVRWAMHPQNADTVSQLRACLKNITHVQLVISRLQRACLSATDWRALYRTLFSLTCIGELCRNQENCINFLQQIGQSASEDLHRAAFLIQRIFDFDASEREARFVVRPGVDTQLDAKKQRLNGVATIMRDVAQLELERLPPDVESCCIIYLPHVGYLLALPSTQKLSSTSAHLEFMFSTSDMLLYKSALTSELDRELGDLQVDIANHESRIMLRLVQTLLSHTSALVKLLDRALMLDVLLAFSTVATEHDWVRPTLHDSSYFMMMKGRHPLYELSCYNEYVPNDACSGTTSCNSGSEHVKHVTVITGPNGSGKTVYLKTVGVAALLAQVGSFVPAERALIKPFNAILVVAPSLPSVTSAFSTFLLEVNQLARALYESRGHSLLLIDEFGSTTYENDGTALLLASLNHILGRSKRQLPQTAEERPGTLTASTSTKSSMMKRSSRNGNSELTVVVEGIEVSSPEGYEAVPSSDGNESKSTRDKVDCQEASRLIKISTECNKNATTHVTKIEQNIRDDGEAQTRNAPLYDDSLIDARLQSPVVNEASATVPKSASLKVTSYDLPHVFVSTHLVTLFDYMQHPENVSPIVLKTVLSPEGSLVPLHQACAGRCVRSEASLSAGLAGLPAEVVQRALQVERVLANGHTLSQWDQLQHSDESTLCRSLVSRLLQSDLKRDSICPYLNVVDNEAKLVLF